MKIIRKENIDLVKQEVEPFIVSGQPKPIHHIKNFILNNKRLIEASINSKFPVLLEKYLEVNSSCSLYLRELSTAFIAVAPKVAEIRDFDENDQQQRWNIDFENLIAILQDQKTPESSRLLSCLKDGMHTWQLPMISNLYRWSDNKNNVGVLEALTFLEKNRHFIKDCLKENVELLKWLESVKNEKNRLILQNFTEDLFDLLNQHRRNGLPVIMDVRRLWQAIYVKKINVTLDRGDSENNSRQLRYKSAENLWAINEYQQFLSVGPCPSSCFLDALIGVESLERNHQVLQVSSDVLMWLMLTHCDNKMIASCIMDHAKAVDQVVSAYCDHQTRPPIPLLASSQGNFLKDLSNASAKSIDDNVEVLSDLKLNKSIDLRA